MQQSERAAVQLLHGCTRDLVLSSTPLPALHRTFEIPFLLSCPRANAPRLPPSHPLSSGACVFIAGSLGRRSALPACHMASATVGRAAPFKRAKNAHKRVADIKNPPFTHRLKGRLVFMQTGKLCGPAPRRAAPSCVHVYVCASI